jgi:PAS domain S-box-containing protein
MAGIQKNASNNLNFMSGGGEMGQLIRSKDWGLTSLGKPAEWAQSLKTTLGILLNSKFPMFLWWGPQLICFYNDAYRPSLGQNGKHPSILGLPAKDAWPEIWHTIEPLINQVLQGGGATWAEDQLIPIYRNGKMEDVYWTFSYSPVQNDDCFIAGVLVTCFETTQSVLTYKSLQQSETQLQFTIEAAELGTWDYNPVTNKFSANKRLKEWFGLNSEKGIDLTDAINVIVDKDRQYVTDAIKNALDYDSGGNYDVEYTIINPVTKKEIILQAKGKVWFNEQRIAYLFNGTLNDVTTEVQAREAKEESEKRFQAAVSAVQGVLWTNNAVGQMEGLQAGWASLTGQSYDEYQGYGWANAVHPDDALATVNAWNESVKERKDFIFEHRVKLKNGEYGLFTIRAIPLFSKDGSLREWVGVHTDITAQKNAAAAILESDKKFRNTVQQAPIGITILRGPEFMVEMANDTYLELVDRKEATFTGRPLFESLPEVEGTVRQLLNDVLRTGNPFHGIEYPIPIKRYGKEAIGYFDFLYHPLREGDGTISGIIVTVTDVSESVKAKHLIAESEKQFRNMVTQSPIPMTILRGKNHVIEMANKVMFENIWRKTETDVIGRSILEAFPELKEQKYSQLLDKVFTTGETHTEKESVAYVEGDDGIKKFYLDFEYAPLFEKDNSISGIIITLNDVTEKVESRQAIEESEQRLRSFVESAPFPIAIYLGKEMRIQMVNQAVLDVWGKGNNVVGKLYAEVLPELEGLGIYEQLEDVFTSGVAFHAYSQRVDLVNDGVLTKYYFNYSFTPLFDIEGHIYGVMNTAADVTGLAMAKQKIEENEEKLNIIIAASELGTWELDLKTNEFIYSKKFLEIFGVDKEKITGLNELLPSLFPEDLPARKKAVREAYKSGVLQYVSRIIWSDQSIHWIENKGKVFYGENNQPVKLIGTTRNITAEKNYQQTLEEREQKFRLLADSMPQLVWTGDVNGIINYYNKSVYNYTGFTEAQVMGEGWLSIVHPDDREGNLKAWLHAITTGTNYFFEHRLGLANGQYRWQLSRAIPQRDAEGNIRMWVGTSTDIQEIREMDEQKDLFIGMASHELKTPVTTIKGYVQLLQTMYAEGADTFLQDSLGTIGRQVANLTTLITDLLDLSKIKAGGLQLAREDFDINEMAEEIIDNAKQVNPGHRISFSKAPATIVQGDKDRLGQVLVNFLTNAVKYSPDSRSILVKTALERDNVIVSVQDAGIGISKGDQQKIFERFYRVEGRNEKTFPGFGIGLFIAAEIIKKHNGNIGVESQQGRGSTFYFSIPMSTAKSL